MADMPSVDAELLRGKYRNPSYEIFIVVDGKKTSYSTAVDIDNAVGIAHAIASSEKLKIMNLSYQQVVPRTPPDGVYLCKLRDRR